MKTFRLFLLPLALISCQENPTNEELPQRYGAQMGEIAPDAVLDNPDFYLCSESLTSVCVNTSKDARAFLSRPLQELSLRVAGYSIIFCLLAPSQCSIKESNVKINTIMSTVIPKVISLLFNGTLKFLEELVKLW
jgi:hypothetical protein